jgi:hypothetical protein
MHSYIWCPYYLHSFMKFCSVVSERTPYVVPITRKFCGSYSLLNLKISRNILLKQLVSTTSLKLLNRISWNLVDSKDTICSCTYYQEILIAWILWELCPFELRNFYIYIYIQVSVRDITLQITPTKFRGSTFPGNMHNYIWCPYYLPNFMKFCSVVSEELCWQAASVVNLGNF